jgi:hypothetical protein
MANKTLPVPQDLMLIKGPANFPFTFSDLTKVKLPGWPPDFNNNPKLKAVWDKAKKEAQRHKNTILSLRIWSPYPILSYCLGDAIIHGERLQLCYFLFPTTFPRKLTHVVAQVIFEIPLDTASGHIERCWMDTLREHELSEDNKKHIRQFQVKHKQDVPDLEYLRIGGKEKGLSFF